MAKYIFKLSSKQYQNKHIVDYMFYSEVHKHGSYKPVIFTVFYIFRKSRTVFQHYHGTFGASMGFKEDKIYNIYDDNADCNIIFLTYSKFHYLIHSAIFFAVSFCNSLSDCPGTQLTILEASSYLGITCIWQWKTV